MNYSPYSFGQSPYSGFTQNNFNQTDFYKSYQPQYQSVNKIGLNGKFINSLDEIMPNDIAMDGSKSVFIMNDLSKVILKSWNANGQIVTSIYCLDNSPEIVTKEEDTRTILARIEEQLKALVPQYRKEQNNEKRTQPTINANDKHGQNESKS